MECMPSLLGVHCSTPARTSLQMTRQRRVQLFKALGLVTVICFIVLVREWALLGKVSDFISESDESVASTFRGQLLSPAESHGSVIFGVSSSGLLVKPVLRNEPGLNDFDTHPDGQLRRRSAPFTAQKNGSFLYLNGPPLAHNTTAAVARVVLPNALMYLTHLSANDTAADKIRIAEALTPRILIPHAAPTSQYTESRPQIIIGIPTVMRLKHEYMVQTLQSLFKNLDAEDASKVKIIVFIAEIFNLTWADALAERLSSMYAEQINRGTLQILSPSPTFYPDFSTLPLTLNDTADRVKWRSKQCLDFAYLMSYALPLGDYYLQLEDDVITKPKYISKILKFIDEQKKNKDWFMLEFSTLGFIGKLFRTSDLPALAEFFIMFYRQKPVDWLLGNFLQVRVCGFGDDKACHAAVAKSVVRLKPSLFQHVGRHSSLAGKVQKLTDADFSPKAAAAGGASPGPLNVLQLTNNPQVEFINLTLNTFQENTIEKAYVGKGYFWATNPKVGDYVFFKFQRPLRLAKLVIESGTLLHDKDRFCDAVVELLECSDIAACDAVVGSKEFVKMAEFDKQDGSVNVTRAADLPLANALRIRVLKDSAFWVVVRRILIDEHKPNS